jgi:hypothetical protein
MKSYPCKPRDHFHHSFRSIILLLNTIGCKNISATRTLAGLNPHGGHLVTLAGPPKTFRSTDDSGRAVLFIA